MGRFLAGNHFRREYPAKTTVRLGESVLVTTTKSMGGGVVLIKVNDGLNTYETARPPPIRAMSQKSEHDQTQNDTIAETPNGIYVTREHCVVKNSKNQG